jgi:hypothetical protein
MKENLTVSAEECRVALGVKKIDTIYAALKAGEIPVIEIGRIKRIPRRWLEEKLMQPAVSSSPEAA